MSGLAVVYFNFSYLGTGDLFDLVISNFFIAVFSYKDLTMALKLSDLLVVKTFANNPFRGLDLRQDLANYYVSVSRDKGERANFLLQ